MTRDEAPRFLADAMLGRLARWLRFLGYDTVYDAALDDAAVVRRAQQEGRVLLTRDRALLSRWRPVSACFVSGDRALEQLEQVLGTQGLAAPGDRMPRCTVCNGTLRILSPAEAEPRVPPYVHRTRKTFHECSHCNRVYWEGSHVARMRQELGRAFLGPGPG